jgi:hypothetical protein
VIAAYVRWPFRPARKGAFIHRHAPGRVVRHCIGRAQGVATQLEAA